MVVEGKDRKERTNMKKNHRMNQQDLFVDEFETALGCVVNITITFRSQHV